MRGRHKAKNKQKVVAVRLPYDERHLTEISQSNRNHIPISVNEHSFENCIHHVLNLVLIFLKLEDGHKVMGFQ